MSKEEQKMSESFDRIGIDGLSTEANSSQLQGLTDESCIEDSPDLIKGMGNQMI